MAEARLKPLFEEAGFRASEIIREPKPANETGTAERKQGPTRIVNLTFDNERPSSAVLIALLDSIAERLGQERTRVQAFPIVPEEYGEAAAAGWEVLRAMPATDIMNGGFRLNWGNRRAYPMSDSTEASASLLRTGNEPYPSLQIVTAAENPAIDPADLAHDLVERLTADGA